MSLTESDCATPISPGVSAKFGRFALLHCVPSVTKTKPRCAVPSHNNPPYSCIPRVPVIGMKGLVGNGLFGLAAIS